MTDAEKDYEENFLKKYRLPTEFGGEPYMSEKEKRNCRVAFWTILALWVGMMVTIASGYKG